MYCENCEKSTKVLIPDEDGMKLCEECTLALTIDTENIIQTSFPNGFIGSWIDTPSFLNKEKNRRYFKIPESQDPIILNNKQYKIIIMEVD